MRQIFILILSLLFATNAYAGLINVPKISEDASIDMLNSNFSILTNEINGSLESVNLAADTLLEAAFADEINPRVRWDEAFSDFTLTGMLPAIDGADLTSDISAGTSYVEGFRVVTSTTANTYTASRDTYVYIDINSTFQFSEVANDAAQPATPSNSLLLAKVVTDGTTIPTVVDRRNLSITLKTDEDFYIKGLGLVSADTDEISIDTGVAYHGVDRFEKTSITGLHLSVGDDWWDGSADSYSGGASWAYIGLDPNGNIKILGDNAPDKADTDSNTAGNLIYWDDGTLLWRVLTEVRVNTTDLTEPAFQRGDIIWFTEKAQVITSTISDNAWSGALSCAAGMPQTSTMAILGLTSTHVNAAVAAIWTRPNNSVLSEDTGNGLYGGQGSSTASVGIIGGQRWGATDISQQINYFNHTGDEGTEIDIEAYETNLRK